MNKNAQINGDREVHKEGCFWMPSVENKKYLGDFYGCQAAVMEAKKYYYLADGCKHCSLECHTR